MQAAQANVQNCGSTWRSVRSTAVADVLVQYIDRLTRTSLEAWLAAHTIAAASKRLLRFQFVKPQSRRSSLSLHKRWVQGRNGSTTITRLIPPYFLLVMAEWIRECRQQRERCCHHAVARTCARGVRLRMYHVVERKTSKGGRPTRFIREFRVRKHTYKNFRASGM